MTPDPGYNGVALLGFNLNESPMTSQQCAYKPADPTAIGPAEISLTGTGMAISFSKNAGSVLRVQLQGANGGMNNATGKADRWCYTITDVQGPVFVPFNKFSTTCWDPSMGTFFDPSKNKVDAVAFSVPGSLIPQTFSYCIAGFATGNDVSAAPAYNPTPYPVVSGTIGGPDPTGGDNVDLQRVKVAAPGPGGKQYIIFNNNWGNPTANDQTLTYKGNSFTITSPTGTGPGNGVPSSFPSIYIGNNGDTQSLNDPPKGSYTTIGNDGLPVQISSSSKIMSTFKYSKNSGDYNATYDIWLASGKPTIYADAVSGFVMVWLYKPSSRNPIGSMVKSVSIGGAMYNVYAGPRGSGTITNRPVISYVAQSSVLSFSGDLMAFIKDAATVTGSTFTQVSTSWYVTDVFGGFEIWDGSSTNGLQLSEFTAVVQ